MKLLTLYERYRLSETVLHWDILCNVCSFSGGTLSVLLMAECLPKIPEWETNLWKKVCAALTSCSLYTVESLRLRYYVSQMDNDYDKTFPTLDCIYIRIFSLLIQEDII